MKVAVVVDSHIFRTPDNKFWCKGITDNTFFQRYTSVFDEVRVVSRVQDIQSTNDGKYLRVDSDNIEVFPMPFARGTKEYLNNYFSFKRMAKESTQDCNCAIFRVPSVLSYMIYSSYKKTKKPFSIEVVVDPVQAYQDNKIAQMLFTKKLKQIALKANGASYVTEHYLQNSYPAYAKIHGESETYFESFYSSIDLNESFFGEAKKYKHKTTPFVFCHTANISKSTVKGQDILIKALGEMTKKGYDAEILFIGDSEIRDYYLDIAKEYKIEDKIKFTGMLASKSEIRDNLLTSDIFVLPTKAEGLPRSIIEAMATGLPCISTPVNGIPELLDDDYMIEQSDYMGFAQKLMKLIDNKDELEFMSERNILKAKEYLNTKLEKRRIEFYKKLYNISK